jgi:hypothetical protein
VSRFIDEADRSQGTLLPETIDEYVSEENPVRVIDAFVGALDLASLGWGRSQGNGPSGLPPGGDVRAQLPVPPDLKRRRQQDRRE